MAQIFPLRRRADADRAGGPAKENQELRFAPYVTAGGKERYLNCYRDAWRIAHGSLAGFDPETCWRGALLRASESADALTAAWLGDTFAGVLALDDRRGAWRGHGWVAFFYIIPELRGKGYGRALLRRAEEHYRAMGRRAQRLTVAPGNPALGFYKKQGFTAVGTERGALEDIFVMEKKL